VVMVAQAARPAVVGSGEEPPSARGHPNWYNRYQLVVRITHAKLKYCSILNRPDE
jgi:hypothetical protein